MTEENKFNVSYEINSKQRVFKVTDSYIKFEVIYDYDYSYDEDDTEYINELLKFTKTLDKCFEQLDNHDVFWFPETSMGIKLISTGCILLNLNDSEDHNPVYDYDDKDRYEFKSIFKYKLGQQHTNKVISTLHDFRRDLNNLLKND